MNAPLDSNRSFESFSLESELDDSEFESMEIEGQENKSEENSTLQNGSPTTSTIKPLEEVKRFVSSLSRKRTISEISSSDNSNNIDAHVNLRSTNKQTQTTSDIQFENVYPNVFGEFMNESAPSNLSKLLELDSLHSKNNETQPDFWDNVKVRPNTAYLKVESFQHLMPPNHQPLSTSGEPIFISLIIPSKAINQESSQNPFVQIVTQLMDVSESKEQLNLPSSSSSSLQII